MSGGPRTLVAAAVALVLLASTPTQGAGFRAEIVDVASGQRVVVEPGARVLHVVFLATWCRPCLDDVPRLSALEAQWGPDGYKLLLVAVPERQSLERLQRFAAQERLPGRLLFDDRGELSRALGADKVPMHLLIDASGDVRLRVASAREIRADDVRAILAGAAHGGSR